MKDISRLNHKKDWVIEFDKNGNIKIKEQNNCIIL